VHGTGLASADEKAVMISVLIVAGGNAVVSAEAVRTLKRHANREYQLVFVDNGSDKEEGLGTAVTSLLLPKDIFIRNDTQRSFAAANNQACALAVGEHLLLLNNDTVTEGDWQTPLLTEGVKYAVSGPMIRQLAVSDKDKAMVCHRINGEEVDSDPKVAGSYVMGWCLFTRKDYYQKLGGLDEVFWPMYCEDSDFCLRSVVEGGKLGKVQVPIRHLGGEDTKKYMDGNFRQHIGMANNYKMYARWVKGAIL
jgi:GT2 family glycosyltransferase